MARFNFIDINLNSKANITEIMNNFKKIESDGITADEVTNKLTDTQKTIENNTTNKLKDYAKTSSLGNLATANYSYGKELPSGGKDGDIYDQYFE